MSFLLYGSTGWIGGMLQELLKAQGETVHLVRGGSLSIILVHLLALTPHHQGKARLENREHVERELDEFKPKYVLNCAGVVRVPLLFLSRCMMCCAVSPPTGALRLAAQMSTGVRITSKRPFAQM